MTEPVRSSLVGNLPPGAVPCPACGGAGYTVSHTKSRIGDGRFEAPCLVCGGEGRQIDPTVKHYLEVSLDDSGLVAQVKCASPATCRQGNYHFGGDIGWHCFSADYMSDEGLTVGDLIEFPTNVVVAVGSVEISADWQGNGEDGDFYLHPTAEQIESQESA